MYKMKRVISLLLAVSMIMSMISTTAFAAVLTSAERLKGSEAVVSLDGTGSKEVTVEIEGIDEMIVYAVEGYWDLADSTGNLTLTGMGSDSLEFDDVYNYVEPSEGYVIWTDDLFKGLCPMENGKNLLTATYLVDKDTPEGEYTVTFSMDVLTAKRPEDEKQKTTAGHTYTATIKVEKYVPKTDINTADCLPVFSDSQDIGIGVGSFTEPAFKVGEDAVTGTLTYTFQGEQYTYAELVAKLAALEASAGEQVNIGYTFTANGNFEGTKTGTLTLTFVDVTFAVTEGAIALKADPTYGDKWNQIVTVDGAKISATLNGTPVEGTYSVLNGEEMPAAGENQAYTVIFTDTSSKVYTVAAGTVTVAPKKITVDTVNIDDKVYDGTTDAEAEVTFGGVVGADVIDYTANVAFTDANAGTDKTASGTVVITNSNYIFNDVGDGKVYGISGKADITALVITAIVADISAQEYTGSEIEPTVTVTAEELIDGDELSFTADYTNNINVGTATVTVKDNDGNYDFADVEKTFQIVEKAIAESDVTLSEGLIYNGSAQDVTVTVKDGAKTLVADTDYEVTDATSGTDAGEYTVTVTGKGNYKGAVSKTWTIAKKDVTVTADNASKVFGEADPTLTSKVEGLIAGDTLNITLQRAAGEDVGSYVITVEAENDNYNITLVNGALTITEKSIAGVTIEAIEDQPYTGSMITPAIVVKDGEKVLVEGTDYTVSCEDNQYVGTATVTVTGKGNYTGTEGTTFNIVTANQNVTIAPEATVTKGGNEVDLKALVTGAQGEVTFTISGEANGCTITDGVLKSGENEGTVTVNVEIAAVDAGGDSEKEYNAASGTITVNVVDKTPVDLAVTQQGMTYGETLADPQFTAPAGSAATITYTGDGYNSTVKPTNAGNYTVTVKCETATEIYTGSANFVIEKATVEVPEGTDYVYDTAAKTGVALNDLYEITGTNTATDAGDYTVTVTLKDAVNYKWASDFSGSITWSIAKAQIVAPTEDAAVYTYNGEAQTYKLAEHIGYTVSADKTQTNAGTYTITVALKNSNYEWSDGTTADKTYTFVIEQAAVEVPEGTDYVYDATAKTGVALNDLYEITGTNTATNAGDYTVTVTLKDAANYKWASDFSGSITWKIAKKTVTVPVAKTGLVYNGAEQIGVAEGDYTLTGVSAAVNAGNYEATAALKDEANYQWSKEFDGKLTWSIAQRKVIIAAVDQEAMVGDKELAAPSYTVSGLVSGESLTKNPTVAYASEVDLNKAGVIEIIVSGAEASDNYVISHVNGTLTITEEDSWTEPSYRIEVEKSENGKIKLSTSAAVKGQNVTITATPDEGCELVELIVTDENGDEIRLSDKGDNKFSFKMPDGKVEIEAVFEKIEEKNESDNPFVDVDEDAYYFDAVLSALENGITNGMSADEFMPNVVCNRAQVVTFLWRAAGSPEPESMVKYRRRL